MDTERHPLLRHLDETGESVTAFAKRVGVSRMLVYRIVNGENTSIDRLKQISAATDGAVPVSSFLSEAAE